MVVTMTRDWKIKKDTNIVIIILWNVEGFKTGNLRHFFVKRLMCRYQGIIE